MLPRGIRTHNLSRRADLRLRTRGHWERLIVVKLLFLQIQGIENTATATATAITTTTTTIIIITTTTTLV